MKFATKVVHVGQDPEKEHGAVIPPIYQTTTYAQHAPAQLFSEYDYTRAGNPNFNNLERVLASLENASEGVVFSSGLGAEMALLMQLMPGDHVIANDDLYGGTFRLLTQLSKRTGITFTQVVGSDLAAWESAITSKTQYLWLETPSNPLLNIIDVAAIAQLGKKHHLRVVVDNTFATPVLQQPLSLGADVVFHSTTKYLGGHSDAIGGAVLTNDAELAKQLRFARMCYGLNTSPFDAWLTHRGVKTLAVRMNQHVSTAKALVSFLATQKKVEAIYYPGLKTHPGHEVAKKQMSNFGGMLSVRFAGSSEKLKLSLAQMKCFTLAESLGGVESLVCHPASMTHASIPKEIREARGVTENVVRFSVGIEDAEDLIADLEKLLKLL